MYYKLGCVALGATMASIVYDGIRDDDWASLFLIVVAFFFLL